MGRDARASDPPLSSDLTTDLDQPLGRRLPLLEDPTCALGDRTLTLGEFLKMERALVTKLGVHLSSLPSQYTTDRIARTSQNIGASVSTVFPVKGWV